VKQKVLQDINDGNHIENYHPDSKNSVGFNPALKNIEYLQNFDKFPLQFSNSDLPTKIHLFRENQKDKLLNQQSAHVTQQKTLKDKISKSQTIEIMDTSTD